MIHCSLIFLFCFGSLLCPSFPKQSGSWGFWNHMQVQQQRRAASELLEAEALACYSHTLPSLRLLEHAFFGSLFSDHYRALLGKRQIGKRKLKIWIQHSLPETKKRWGVAECGMADKYKLCLKRLCYNLVATRRAMSLVSWGTKWKLQWFLLSKQNSFNSQLNILHIKQYFPCHLHGTWASCCL